MTKQEWNDEAARYQAKIDAEMNKLDDERDDSLIDFWSVKRNACFEATAYATVDA